MQIECAGVITGPAEMFKILPPEAKKVKSWDNDTRASWQKQVATALKEHGYFAESVPGSLNGRKRTYHLYAYRSKEERQACFAFHRPPEPEPSDEGIGFRLP